MPSHNLPNPKSSTSKHNLLIHQPTHNLIYSPPTQQNQDEEELEEIDPTAIRSRRTRGVRVDYTSKEALEKAGLKPEDMDKDDD